MLLDKGCFHQQLRLYCISRVLHSNYVCSTLCYFAVENDVQEMQIWLIMKEAEKETQWQEGRQDEFLQKLLLSV